MEHTLSMSVRAVTHTRLKVPPGSEALSRNGCKSVHHVLKVCFVPPALDVMTITTKSENSSGQGMEQVCRDTPPRPSPGSAAIMAP